MIVSPTFFFFGKRKTFFFKTKNFIHKRFDQRKASNKQKDRSNLNSAESVGFHRGTILFQLKIATQTHQQA